MVSVVALVSVAGLAWAPAQPPADQPPPPPGERSPERRPEGRPGQEGRQPPGGGGGQRRENVNGVMKSMNRAMKALKGQIADASKKDDCLRLIGEMERACVTAKTAGLPGDVLKTFATNEEKAKMAGAFRTHLIAATRKLLDAEEDIVAGKGDAAKKKLDELIEMRDKAHDLLGIKEE
jgi:hypothetical protein